MKPRLKRALALALGPFVALSLCEVGVRAFRPKPRTQVVAPSHTVTVWPLHGTRVWQEPDGAAREAASCEAALRVGVFGSSILYGSGVDNDQVWTASPPDGTCLHNYSAPGYGYEAKLARLTEEVDALDVVVWEHWANDSGRFIWVGERGYNLPQGVPLDQAGNPDAFGLPTDLNQALFRNLRLYEYAALARLADSSGSPSLIAPLDEVRRLAGDKPLIVVVPPFLHESFVRSTRSPPPHALGVDLWAEQNDAQVIHLAMLLEDLDYREVRLDPCCHYNPAGHAALAERLVPLLPPPG